MANNELLIDLTANEERLFELFVAECDRNKVKPSISDFVIWLEESGYNDDLEDVSV